MKRLSLILALLMFAMLTFTACGVTAPITNDAPYEAGTIDENGYSSKWLGLSFTPSDNIVIATEEEMRELGMYAEEETGASGVYEMMATDAVTFGSVVVLVEAAVAELTAEKYVDALKAQLDSQLDGVTYSDVVKEKILGAEYTCFEYGVDAYGVSLNQTMLVRKLADRIVSICFTYSSDAEFEALFDCFKAY
ncbi:MAG: hypothetical protein IJF48_04395 [Clostridia bacterium]|nr:hypothetical protein [Clostridia bacterium]